MTIKYLGWGGGGILPPHGYIWAYLGKIIYRRLPSDMQWLLIVFVNDRQTIVKRSFLFRFQKRLFRFRKKRSFSKRPTRFDLLEN